MRMLGRFISLFVRLFFADHPQKRLEYFDKTNSIHIITVKSQFHGNIDDNVAVIEK